MPWSDGAERHRRLAGQHAGAGDELEAVRSTELRDGRDEIEGGPDRPLGIVLVRDRCPQTAMTASPMNFSTVPP